MEQIAYSSIPEWARPAAAGDRSPAGTPAPPAGGYGRTRILVGIGPDGPRLAARWRAEFDPEGSATTVLFGVDRPHSAEVLRYALSRATVGVRLLLTGPPGDCLALRATALSAGLCDDEIAVAPVGTGPVDVHCAHCRAVTPSECAVGDRVRCLGCGRDLVVYHHLSRRTGRFLGFQEDAETARPADVDDPVLAAALTRKEPVR
ncbi:MAG: dimethylamine monooxygenase subunit DmmA family protein [Gordonia sp. (in: high G+C Gram-positive bacteria)]|uniref:dimethylamine monooxygenase subunit DmmA family protein n=1 Tax=Gordonia sp. (in: high G+C Gram-positive bacteria) TaxID=84139 RepID=UPI0039E4CE05